MLPLSGSTIRLLTGIKWRPDYKHTRFFNNFNEQNNFFNSLTPKTVIPQANFVRVEGRHTLQVPYHIDTLWDVNYLMFRNEQYNKWFYCFVTKLEYVNKGNTRVHFEVDAFQTWFLNCSMQPSYIERKHVTEYVGGLPTINTLEEGLDYGTMYDTIEVSQVKPSGDVLFLVIVAKELMDEVEDGSVIQDSGEVKPNVNGSVQPLTFYIVPYLRDGSVPAVVSPFNVSPAKQVLEFMYEADSALNNIVSIYTTDYIGLNNASDSSVYFDPAHFKRVTILKGTDQAQSVGLYRLTNLYSYQPKTITVGSKYPTINQGLPSKLYMSPYYKIFLDDFNGNRTEIKAEYINSPNINVKVKGSVGTSNKVSYEVLAYNYTAGSPFIDQVELEYGLINKNPNDVPIITDMLGAYLQGNRNSIENQTNQIMWDSITGVIGGAGSTITAGIGRDAGGVAGGLNGMLQSTAGGIFALQGIQAKQKDIQNTPPSITNMSGNTYFTQGNNYRGMYVIKKMIKPEYRQTLTDFFKRYGYKYNRVEVPEYRTRQSYNFIKTLDCLFSGSIPQEYLIQLQNIFDNGITLWHTDDIGNYNLGNGER